MSITVANFITQYLRPSLASVTDFPDATLGYWIDAALLDVSRSFPRTSYALWDTLANTYTYLYADSTTIADESTIIRLLNCIYPYNLITAEGPALARGNHMRTDWIGSGDFYDPDNDYQVLYIAKTITAGQTIYADAHLYWKTATATIINPSSHYELIRLFCIWQAFLHQVTDASTSPVPDPELLSSLSSQALAASMAYQAAYQKLDESKATSVITNGWVIDKWDRNIRPTSGQISGITEVPSLE
jgi:hypothetical protein